VVVVDVTVHAHPITVTRAIGTAALAIAAVTGNVTAALVSVEAATTGTADAVRPHEMTGTASETAGMIERRENDRLAVTSEQIQSPRNRRLIETNITLICSSTFTNLPEALSLIR